MKGNYNSHLHVAVLAIVLISLTLQGTDAGKKPCKDNPSCGEHGVCKRDRKAESGFKCKCRNGYSGTLCDTSPCTYSLCKNGGMCVEDDGKHGFYCDCEEGYGGDICNIDLNPCKNLPCDNEGECVMTEELGGHIGFHCVCTEEYTGERCERYADECKNYPCKNSGTCVSDSSVDEGFRCLCDTDNYVGDLCQLPLDANGCRPGYEYVLLNNADKERFDYTINPNNIQYKEEMFHWIFKGSSYFMVMQGLDSIRIREKNESAFYVLHVSLEVQEVRTVKIEFKQKTGGKRYRTVATEKIKPDVKGVFTTTETETIPSGGYKVEMLVLNFLRTNGRNKENGLPEPNQFWVRNLQMETCVPTQKQ